MEKDHGKVVFPMTEIVLDMVALIFKGIKSFIFYFPPTAATFNHGDNIVAIDKDVGNPTVSVGDFIVL